MKAQNLDELRYIVQLTHDEGFVQVRENGCYLVEHWPEPNLAILAKDDHSVISVFDSVYYSPDITHAKVFNSMDEARSGVRFLKGEMSAWNSRIIAVSAKVFFVAGLTKSKWE